MALRCFAAAVFSLVISTDHTAGNYHWRLALAAGRGCWIPHCREGQWPLAVRPIEGPGGRLWMFEHSAAWSSGDGTEWRREQATAGWGERYGGARAYALGRLWFAGGGATWARFENDVWSSPDGIRWTRLTENAAWPDRRGAALLEFGGRLWLLGGEVSSGRIDRLPVRGHRDVWSSADGVSWSRVGGDAPWRSVGCALSFQGSIWVIGDGAAWRSSDGANWILAGRHEAALRRTGNGCAVFRRSLWVFGGIGAGDSTRNDAWLSGDGESWVKLDVPSPWSPRGGDHAVVFRNNLWIYGGKTGRNDGYSDEVWRLDPGAAPSSYRTVRRTEYTTASPSNSAVKPTTLTTDRR